MASFGLQVGMIIGNGSRYYDGQIWAHGPSRADAEGAADIQARRIQGGNDRLQPLFHALYGWVALS
jgi:hypothetical protein